MSSNLTQFLDSQSKFDTLRFITCGSVDDGKSTLIGRILYETQMIFEDQVERLKSGIRKIEPLDSEFDFSLLLDGLTAEREQGITIDVAHRYFSTSLRRFIVADTPGHQEYTRNMVTGASNADLAVILIDSRKGVLAQTRRHSLICATLGIKHVVIAINKMDLMDYSEEVFIAIQSDFLSFAKELEFDSCEFIPISALHGVNLRENSRKTNWFKGPTLLGYLETINVVSKSSDKPLRMPIQWVNRSGIDFRGFSGLIESGDVSVGQNVVVSPSGETATVKEIVFYKDKLHRAGCGSSVTLVLDREIDISRGDVLTSHQHPIEVADQFQAKLVWMDREKGFVGRNYFIKIGTKTVGAQITQIKHKINVNTFEKLPAIELSLNDLSVVTLKTDSPVPFEEYENSKGLGGFILIDRMSNNTVGAGMVDFALRRSNNIYIQKQAIGKLERRKLNRHASKVIWLTGLSGSGKSTIANELEKHLYSLGIRTYILDGDNIRHGLNKDLGFSDADRVENIRRISELAKLFVDAGIVVICAFISPFEAERKMARAMFEEGEFLEAFVDVPLEIAEKRDTKGLYRKARSGELPNFTGIGSPFEKPSNPDFHLPTDEISINEAVAILIEGLDLS